MQIWYLDHSGFAVETSEHMLIFDYYKDIPRGGSLENGVVNPNDLQDKKVIVFVSHRHPDHYNKKIFSWKKSIKDIRYVLADDIKSKETATFLHGGQEADLGDVQIKALHSTDEGVAFLVKLDGVCIYHAGDLNWWHWKGEADEYNTNMAKEYCHEIDLLHDEKIDLAFVPVDPRLEENYLRGINYFMQNTQTNKVVPVHFWDDFSIFKKLQADPDTLSYRDKIINITKRGENISGI